MLVFGLGGSSDVIVCDALGRRARLFSKYPPARWSLSVFLIMRHDPAPPVCSSPQVTRGVVAGFGPQSGPDWRVEAGRTPRRGTGADAGASSLPCLWATSWRCLPAPDSGAPRQTLTNCPACCPPPPAITAAKSAEIGLKTVNCRKARNGCPSEQS